VRIQTPQFVEPLQGSLDIQADDSRNELARIHAAYSRRTDQSRYSPFDPANSLAAQEREKEILSTLARHGRIPLGNLRILEIGCGTGYWLREFVRWGARPENITGIDLLPERIAEATILCPSQVTLRCQNAAQTDYSSGAFDLVFQSTVFTSILSEHMKTQVAREMLRVLRPSGTILWYDFTVNNPWNADVRGIPRKEIMHLFPQCRFEFQRLTLAPPIGRPLSRASTFLYRALSALKIFDTHCLATIHKAC
jgi:ubiquinone/menaquinone biosynthesis C-methylase UbiE